MNKNTMLVEEQRTAQEEIESEEYLEDCYFFWHDFLDISEYEWYEMSYSQFILTGLDYCSSSSAY